MIFLKLFLSFLQVGAFSVGGGYAAMPFIQSEVVDRYGWLTIGEFTDLITIAEMTPGPIAVNSATFVGIRIAGIPGALVATLGCILPSCVIVSLVAYVFYRYKNMSAMQDVLSGLRPAVVALIAAAGLTILQMVALGGKTASLANVNWLGLGIFAGAFVILRKWKWNPILVMVLAGGANLLLSLLLGSMA